MRGPAAESVKYVTDGSTILWMGESSHGILSDKDIIPYVSLMVRELGNHRVLQENSAAQNEFRFISGSIKPHRDSHGSRDI